MRSDSVISRRFVRRTVGLTLLALIPLSLALPAAAQEPPPAQQPADSAATPKENPPGKVTEEITVTATLREEKVEDVPFSVAAPTEEQLRERGVDSIEGIATSTPGFTVQNLGPGQSQVAVRGVSSGQIVRDQPGVKEQVGVYLDDTGISLSLFTPDVDLFDMSRVEVLRGPQGTLFGAGSAAGTLRYITNQPLLGKSEAVTEFTGNDITGGSPGGSAKAAINTPLGDKAALRIAAYYNRMGGFIDAVQPNLSVKKDVNSGDRSGARVALKLEPNDRLTITPRILYQKVTTDGWNREDAFNILANPYTTTRPAVRLGERQQFTQIPEPFTDKFVLTDLNVGYKLSQDLSLTSITAYTDRDVLVVRDATALTASITGGSIGLPPNVYTLNAPLDDATTARLLTQEFRLAGKEDRLDWVAGVFYSNMKRNYGQDLLVSGFEALSGIPTQGNFGAAKDVLYFSRLHYKLDQTALFGEATWKATDHLDLTGGLRYYDFRENRVQTFDGIFASPGTTQGSVSATGFAPRLIASLAVTEATKWNAQVSKGFRLGGINDPLNVPLCTPQDLLTFSGRDRWKDEEVYNYEIGTKTKLARGGFFNVAAYYMDIRDLQATVTAGSCSSRLIFNVPKARSTGIEVEWNASLGDSFDFSISANYGKSELRSTLTSTDASGNVAVVSGIQSGNRLPTVPEFQAAVVATYRWTVKESWLGYLTGIYQYVGSRFTQIGDQAAGFGLVDLNSFGANTIGGPLTQSTFRFNPELPAYELTNLRLGVTAGQWDVAVFVNNLFDENALLALDQERGTRARVGFLVSQPRTFGVTARVNIR